MYLIVFVFMCWKKKKKIKLMGKKWWNSTSEVSLSVMACEAADKQTRTASRFVFTTSLPPCHAPSTPLLPALSHILTLKSAIPGMWTHSRTEKMLTPLFSGLLLLLNQQKHLSGISLRCPPPLKQPPSTPPTPRPLQHHHDGTNIPVEIWVITSWPSH